MEQRWLAALENYLLLEYKRKAMSNELTRGQVEKLRNQMHADFPLEVSALDIDALCDLAIRALEPSPEREVCEACKQPILYGDAAFSRDMNTGANAAGAGNWKRFHTRCSKEPKGK